MTEIIEAKNVSKAYKPNGREVPAIEDVSFKVNENDFLCIVGPSGCGKSTLLKLIMGLEKPSSGSIEFKTKNSKKIGMVFQSFAIFPWLTVIENVKLALDAINTEAKMGDEEKISRAKKYISIVGLDGFESAYPKELSGGMKQRVGVARALAIEPEILCMDEPFSSLDVLTAENLREEVLMLWQDPDLPPNAVIMVTHNIEEAIYLASRIVVLSGRPGKIVDDFEVNLPRPRDRKSEDFYRLTDKIYGEIA